MYLGLVRSQDLSFDPSGRLRPSVFLGSLSSSHSVWVLRFPTTFHQSFRKVRESQSWCRQKLPTTLTLHGCEMFISFFPCGKSHKNEAVWLRTQPTRRHRFASPWFDMSMRNCQCSPPFFVSFLPEHTSPKVFISRILRTLRILQTLYDLSYLPLSPTGLPRVVIVSTCH